MNSKTKTSLEIRALKKNTVEISGYVNAVERPSDVLFSKEHGGKFIERMMSGAFKKALSHNTDGVALLLNHDANLNYGSTKRGNLKLEEDNIGLRVTAIVEDEEFYKKAHNGELNSWSFGFYDRDVVERWSEEWGLTTREVYDLDLVEVSMLDRTKIPAYPGTQLNYRDVDGMQYRTWDIVPESVKFVGFEEQEKKERGENAMNENLEIRATSENEEPMVEENKLPTEEEICDMTEKAVDEKKFDLQCEAQKILSGAENRNLTDTEISRLNEFEKNIENLDKKFRKSETARLRGVFNKSNELEQTQAVAPTIYKKRFLPVPPTTYRRYHGVEAEIPDYLDALPPNDRAECKAFRRRVVAMAAIDDKANFRNKANFRDGELVYESVEPVVPTVIVNQIIQNISETSPVFDKATHYSKPQVDVPYYDTNNGAADVTVKVIKDFDELESKVGTFKTISLKSALTAAPVLIGKSSIRDAQPDILNFIVDRMTEKIREFIDQTIFSGNENDNYSIDGLSKLKNSITAKAQNKITPDELKILRNKLYPKFQENAIWVMHPETWAAIDILVDGVGRYLVPPDYSLQSSTPHFLLSKPVFLSEFMPKAEAGKAAIYYGDFKQGLAINTAENLKIEYYNMVPKHAIGLYGFMAWDAKVVNEQAIIKLTMKA